MREIDPSKWYQFIRSYPFKWRYFKGPYDTKEDADKDLHARVTVSERTVMLGSYYLKLREEYDERRSVTK